MTDEQPFQLDQLAPDPPPRVPRRWLVATAVALSCAALGAVIIAAFQGGAGAGSTAAQASPSRSLAFLPTNGPSPSPSPLSLEPIAASSSPAWTPCDPVEMSSENYCQDYATDSCDAAFASNENGSLLDAFIENKLYVDPNRLKDCPQFLTTWKRAQTGFNDGSYEVGKEIKPGAYETTAHLIGGRVTDCYWERGGANGQIIDNNFVTAAKKVRVTVRATDQMFTTRGCGDWVKVG